MCLIVPYYNDAQHVLLEALTTYDIGAHDMQSAVPYRNQASSFRNF